MTALARPSLMPRADLPSRVTIWEVGARDGLQNESTVVPTTVKVELIDRLSAAGLPVVEATSVVRPDRVPQLADAVDVMSGITRRDGVRYPVLVPNLRGLESALAAGVDDIAVFASATEAFAQRNLGRAMADQMAMFAPVIAGARERGLGVRGYVSMCFGDPWEGAVDPGQVVAGCGELLAAGCTSLSLGDTIGVATPGQVRDLVGRLVAAGVELDAIGVHFHDTYGQALANTLSALEVGVTTVDSSAGGLGGCPFAESATGNLATEDLVWMLDGLGVETGVDLDALVATSLWMARQLGRPPASRVVQARSRASVTASGADDDPLMRSRRS
jgi:hydroxymethylglutaryl-CoA lyase